jgi:tetratricopeptide (TPR) repeat protein
MDQFTAHLDRGWDLAQRGDFLGAEASARRAMELEGDSPEAHNLLGFSCALRGEHEEALELYQQAIALDDTFLEALLNAAELCVHPLGDPEAALEFCKDALELVESDEELTDALLLKFDALLGLGREDEAKQVCTRLPKPPFVNPVHSFLVGRAFFETGQIEAAEKLLLEAAQRDPDNPEPHYYLGMIRNEDGDARGCTEAFLLSRELDQRLPQVPWGVTRDAFAEAVKNAVAGLVPRLRALVHPDEVFIADTPGVEVVVEGADPRTPVLLDALEGSTAPLRVFVYQRNVERICGAAERIEETIRTALEREIANAAFGEMEAPSAELGTLN